MQLSSNYLLLVGESPNSYCFHLSGSFYYGFALSKNVEANNYGNVKPLLAQNCTHQCKGSRESSNLSLGGLEGSLHLFPKDLWILNSSVFPVHFLQVTVEELGEGQGKSTILLTRVSNWGDIQTNKTLPLRTPETMTH